jgi:hypothetical protein
VTSVRNAVSWESVAAAIALITAENAGEADSLEVIAGDAPHEEIIGVLALLAGCFLRELRAAPGAPGIGQQGAAGVLQAIGLRVLELAVQEQDRTGRREIGG